MLPPPPALHPPPVQSLLSSSLPARMFVRVGVRWRHNQIFSYGLVTIGYHFLVRGEGEEEEEDLYFDMIIIKAYKLVRSRRLRY